jgi:subtilase family serine protease
VFRQSVRLLAAACFALALAAPSALADKPSDPGSQGQSHRSVCPPAAQGYARCSSQVVTDQNGKPLSRPAVRTSYNAAALQSAYKLNVTSGANQTIAIVDAYDSPTAESDLATYRSQNNLPACTSSGPNPCFRKIDQRGGTSYPNANTGWAQEISLDLDMASAICPNCKILLVEADSNSFNDLTSAVRQAASQHATEISNSYGGNEFFGQDDGAYNQPGVAVTVSSGDSGFGAEFPATSPFVTAVGGTTLTRAAGTSRGWAESAWSGAGSGCSAVEAKPSWQHDSGCSRRSESDTSAVADPNTGVQVVYNGQQLVFGGTSASSPIIAGVYALAGGQPNGTTGAQGLWNNHSSLFDVTSGSNGRRCSAAYLCNSGTGYDGPTGWGTPNGSGSF